MNRDALGAQKSNDKGLLLVGEEQFNDAERKFREALEYDLYYAPAHNNLGIVLLKRGQHYEAAWEFQYAARLAPNAVEPRQNLGLLYETLGRLDRAITEYETALEIQPNDLVAMRHLARAYVKADPHANGLRALLEKLLLMPLDRQWDVWVRGQLIRLGRPETEGEPEEPPSPFGAPTAEDP